MSAQSAIFNPTNTTSAATGDGFSVPRLTTTGRLAITFGTSDAGMMVYDTTLNNLFIWNGSAWESVPASGDAGANGSVQYNDNGVVSGAVNFVWDKTNNRVGIQITSPTAPLEVGETSGTALRLRRLTSGNTIDVNFYNTNTTVGDVAGIRCDGDGLSNTFGAISFWTTQTPNSLVERYRISSVGVHTWQNVGGVAGTAMTLNSTGLGVGGSPVNKMTVTVVPGTSTSDGLRVTDSTRSIIAGQTGATYSYLGIGGNQNLIYTSGGRLDIVADGQSLFLRTGTNNYLNLDSSGNVGIGVTPSGSGGCLQLKSGITFPATQVASSDANTLDDYEEGTWTIVVNNQLGNSATIASQIARYVKIGRRVFVFGDFTLSAKGAAAAGNLVYLGNLPFVPNSTLFEGSVVHKYDNVNLTTNGQINIISAAGGNNVCFFPISSATTGTSNLTFGQITDTTRLVFNFSYDV